MRPAPLPSAAVLAFALLLAGCAGEGAGSPGTSHGPPPPGGPGASGRASGCGPLFVSPAGEPFRAEPDAPVCPLRTWFARADADGDGALSRAEFRDDALRFFAVLDTDGNGYVDGLELQAYEHRIAPEILGAGGGRPRASIERKPHLRPAALQMGGGGGMGGMGGQGGTGGGGRRGRGRGSPDEGAGVHRGLEGGGGLARFGLLDEPEPVASADLDFDGRITRAEFATRAGQRFDHLDEANAGRLTYPDLETRMRARRGAGPGDGGGPSGGGGRHGGRGGRGGGMGGGPQA